MEETTLNQIMARRADLETAYHQVLRETLFTNRTQIRPAKLKQVATEEVAILLDFLQNAHYDTGFKRGESLYQLGLSYESMLRLGQATREFCLAEFPPEISKLALKATDNYYQAMVLGFSRTHEKVILEEQERIRAAMEQTISYRTKQLELAAGMGQVCQTTLDLNSLLETALEFLQMNLNFYFTGIFLVDEQNNWLVLRAANGEIGQELLRQKFKLEISDESTIGWCMLRGKYRILQNAVPEITLPVATPTQIVLPLISPKRTLGAITLHHERMENFSEQDLSALDIVADQLANAIENASLYTESQAKLQESQQTLRTVVMNMPIVLFALDKEGVFTLLEGKGLEVWGMESEKFIGQSAFEIYEQSPQIIRDIQLAFKGETIISVMELADSSCDIQYLPIRDENEQVIGITGLAWGIAQHE